MRYLSAGRAHTIIMFLVYRRSIIGTYTAPGLGDQAELNNSQSYIDNLIGLCTRAVIGCHRPASRYYKLDRFYVVSGSPLSFH